MARAAVCFASADAEFAETVSRYLAAQTSLHCELAAARNHEDFLDVVEQCVVTDVVIVVVSSRSVPASWPRAVWERVLVEGPKEAGARIAFVMVDQCAFPQLLRRRNFVDFTEDSEAGLRALRRWVIQSMLPDREAPQISGVCVPDESLRYLVDEAGVKTGVAAECAAWLMKTHWQDFDGAHWISCGHRTRAGILGELAQQIGLRLAGTVEQNWIQLREHATSYRSLYVFEHLAGDKGDVTALGGKSSVLVVPGIEPKPISLADLREMFFARKMNESACLHGLWVFMSSNEGGNWGEVYSIGLRALKLLQDQGRLAEAYELLEWLTTSARKFSDARALELIRWEEGWILEAWDLPVSSRTEFRRVSAMQLPLSL